MEFTLKSRFDHEGLFGTLRFNNEKFYKLSQTLEIYSSVCGCHDYDFIIVDGGELSSDSPEEIRLYQDYQGSNKVYIRNINTNEELAVSVRSRSDSSSSEDRDAGVPDIIIKKDIYIYQWDFCKRCWKRTIPAALYKLITRGLYPIGHYPEFLYCGDGAGQWELLSPIITAYGYADGFETYIEGEIPAKKLLNLNINWEISLSVYLPEDGDTEIEIHSREELIFFLKENRLI